MANAKIKRETELGQRFDSRNKFWLQAKFSIRFALKISAHSFYQWAESQPF